MENERSASVSVVIPALNEGRALRETLPPLRRAREIGHEVLLMWSLRLRFLLGADPKRLLRSRERGDTNAARRVPGGGTTPDDQGP